MFVGRLISSALFGGKGSPKKSSFLDLDALARNKLVIFHTMDGATVMQASLGALCQKDEQTSVSDIKALFQKTVGSDSGEASFVWDGIPLDESIFSTDAEREMQGKTGQRNLYRELLNSAKVMDYDTNIEIEVLWNVARDLAELQKLGSNEAGKMGSGMEYLYSDLVCYGHDNHDVKSEIDLEKGSLLVTGIPTFHMMNKKKDRSGRVIYAYEKPARAARESPQPKDDGKDLLMPALNLQFLVEQYWNAKREKEGIKKPTGLSFLTNPFAKLSREDTKSTSTACSSDDSMPGDSGDSTSENSSESEKATVSDKKATTSLVDTAPVVESVTVSVEINSDASNNGLGVKFALRNMGFSVEQETLLKEHNKAVGGGFIYSSGLYDKDDKQADDGVRNFTMKFHPGMGGAMMRAEGHATGRGSPYACGNQNMGYDPLNWSQSGNQFQVISVTLPTTAADKEADNVFSLKPESSKVQVVHEERIKEKRFAGRYVVFDKKTQDTIVPSLYAHQDMRAAPVYYKNISIQLNFAK